VRTTIRRLRDSGFHNKERWWHLLQSAVDSLNAREIRIKGKGIGFAPRDVNHSNVDEVLGRLQKRDPSYFYTQFQIAPQLANFKFQLHDVVRPKLIVTSSEVIGVKRSERSLEGER